MPSRVTDRLNFDRKEAFSASELRSRPRMMTFSSGDIKNLTYKPLTREELKQMQLLFKQAQKKFAVPEVPKQSSRAWARRLSVDEVDIGFEELSNSQNRQKSILFIYY